MDRSDKDIVALSGGHTLVLCMFLSISGFVGYNSISNSRVGFGVTGKGSSREALFLVDLDVSFTTVPVWATLALVSARWISGNQITLEMCEFGYLKQTFH
ncbi:hypothetical protein V6N11_027065 [Hibiscus sabdariffa]|uniref:Uncharacterized protein n=1 Tax=Hibiscus sabdariffa TaxID=183260 RepID=A0ABR2PFX2_9ROSI